MPTVTLCTQNGKNTMSDKLKRVWEIEECIRRSFKLKGTTKFWPDQFRELGFGTNEEVCVALGVLVLEKKLLPTIQIGAPDNTLLWAGPPEEFVKILPLAYQGAKLTVFFTISKAWLDSIAWRKNFNAR